jgi:hypothetical protein
MKNGQYKLKKGILKVVAEETAERKILLAGFCSQIFIGTPRNHIEQ